MEKIQSDEKASRGRFHRLARLPAIALVVFGCAFSAPAMACFCNCSIFSPPPKHPDPTALRPAEYYDQIFSGLIISTEHTREPVVSPMVVVGKTASGEDIVLNPGYWIRSRVLVLRIWRGTPSTVAEVWTPIVTDCDVPPVPGFHFVALVRREKGRSVAENTYCDCTQEDAVTEGRGAFAVAGIAIIAAAISAAVLAVLVLVRIVRRRRSAG